MGSFLSSGCGMVNCSTQVGGFTSYVILKDALTVVPFSLQAAVQCWPCQHNFICFVRGRSKFMGFYAILSSGTCGLRETTGGEWKKWSFLSCNFLVQYPWHPLIPAGGTDGSSASPKEISRVALKTSCGGSSRNTLANHESCCQDGETEII